ncbi:MAG TPA: 50S ribosomal protein L24 [Gammaproteobacteria bacterium]|jgi:large subunit ribosomal protein L24|nr:50S ribosomal protein L24 [Gammaproteobacteria bacterium]
MNKIKKGDDVIVIAGKDKGKRGVVLSVLEGGRKLLVEGINLVKKHVKTTQDKPGAIVLKSMPIDRSNVQLYDPEKGKGSRVGIRVLEDGKRVRFLKASGQLVSAKE